MINVKRVHVLHSSRLEIHFSDGTFGTVNMLPIINERKEFFVLKDKKVFETAHIDGGTVAWKASFPGYETIDVASETLYAMAHNLPIPGSYEEAVDNEKIRKKSNYIFDGFRELYRAADTLNYTRQTESLSSLSSEELIKLVRACWASEWDVFPDALSEKQIKAILSGDLAVPEFKETNNGLVPIDPA